MTGSRRRCRAVTRTAGLHAVCGDRAGLATGHDLVTAVRDAKDYVTRAIALAPQLGKGHGPLRHFWK